MASCPHKFSSVFRQGVLGATPPAQLLKPIKPYYSYSDIVWRGDNFLTPTWRIPLHFVLPPDSNLLMPVLLSRTRGILRKAAIVLYLRIALHLLNLYTRTINNKLINFLWNFEMKRWNENEFKRQTNLEVEIIRFSWSYISLHRKYSYLILWFNSSLINQVFKIILVCVYVYFCLARSWYCLFPPAHDQDGFSTKKPDMVY